MPRLRPRQRRRARILERLTPISILLAGSAPGCRLLPARLERLLIEPAAANVAVGGRQAFRAVGLMSDGKRVSVNATFSATGGTISPGGSFTAANDLGAHRVIATAIGQPLADTAAVVITTASAHNYTTTFPETENPISDGGRWINGGVVGGDWTDVSTTPGFAIGRQVGAPYTDATALLSGIWGPDQRVTARVFTRHQNGNCFQEVEMRLRSTVTPSRSTGYEISFKAAEGPWAYLAIVRWNGKVGDFTNLYTPQGAKYGLRDGDVVSASIAGNVITAYRNGLPLGSARDDTYTAGKPGIGFNLENKNAGCPGTNGDYGFTSMTATDDVREPAAANVARQIP